MNGFLVLARCRMDDVPVLLESDTDRAKAFASNLTLNDVQESRFCEVASIDVSELIAVDLLRFANGKITEIVHVKS